MSLEWGLSDEALRRLGYRHPLGKVQKALFLLSVPLGFIPFWILLRSQAFAGDAASAVAAFLVHVLALAGLLFLLSRSW